MLKVERNRGTTKRAYYNTWKNFNQFIIKLDKRPPTWEERLVLYVGYLVSQRRKASTIKSYISAIRSVLREDGVVLNEDKYVLTSLTKACRYINDEVQTRLPIQIGVLVLIIRQVKLHFQNQPYMRTLFSALFITAYFGLLRVGELPYNEHVIKARDVHLAQNKNQVLFILRSSKTHWSDNKPQLVKICERTIQLPNHNLRHKSNTCPFKWLEKYLIIRPMSEDRSEQFFAFSDNSPVKPMHARNTLKIMLSEAGLDPLYYGMHSFRIGRASALLKLQFSVKSIKKLSRWHSNAIYTYLRHYLHWIASLKNAKNGFSAHYCNFTMSKDNSLWYIVMITVHSQLRWKKVKFENPFCQCFEFCVSVLCLVYRVAHWMSRTGSNSLCKNTNSVSPAIFFQCEWHILCNLLHWIMVCA